MLAAGRDVQRSLERLATGKRINRASDDPAGLVAVTGFKQQIVDIQARLRAMDQDEAMLGAREGSNSVLSDMLVELRGLVVRGANRDAMSVEERRALQGEVDGIIGAIDFVSQTSRFKGIQLLTGFSATNLGRGVATDAQGGALSLNDLRSGKGLDLLAGNLEDAQKVVDAAASAVGGDRAGVGGRLRQMDAMRDALQVELENLDSARSMIEDTDYAQETAKLVRGQTLEEAARFVKQLAEEQRATAASDLLKGVVDRSRS